MFVSNRLDMRRSVLSWSTQAQSTPGTQRDGTRMLSVTLADELPDCDLRPLSYELHRDANHSAVPAIRSRTLTASMTMAAA
jgi:hypothetical protein